MSTTVADKLVQLHDLLAGMDGVLVAFSGGTDSSLVAAAAAKALGDRALAVTAISPSLAPGEAEDARAVARRVGIRHRTVRTHEAEDPAYLANGVDRCYHCKDELYDVLTVIAAEAGLPVIASGANADDLKDVRPGLRAAAEHGIRHPLVEVGMTKHEVREAAKSMGVPNWDKPASACLSSRIEHGVTITVDLLTKVGRAERIIKDLGFRQCRVRVHGQDLVRVEVEKKDLDRMNEPAMRAAVVAALTGLGYRYITLDLEGFRSGSMNPVSP